MKTLLALSLIAAGAHAPIDTPEPAAKVVASAVAQAEKEHKHVMVIFHASWCGWCKRLDGWMATPKAKAFFEKEFVVAHLDVLEQGDKKKLENEGGAELMKKWKGENAGLPFTVILNSKGEMVVNSNSEKEGTAGNIGCPWKAEEQDWFFGMIMKARPEIARSTIDDVRATLVDYVKANGG